MQCNRLLQYFLYAFGLDTDNSYITILYKPIIIKMKKISLAILLLAMITVAAAQNPRTIIIKANENSVVKDSSGMVYPYIIWQKLYTSGEYKMRVIDPRVENPEFLIAKLTDDELDARYSKMPRPVKSENFKDGEKILSFSTSDIDGKKLKLKDLAGKVVVLNFWFIGCPPCRMELPALNQLSVKYANDSNVVFIAIALDDESSLRDFLKLNHLGYHVVSSGQDYARLYKIHLFPTNLVVDKEGKVVFSSVGYSPATPYWIKKSIEESKQKGI